MKIDRNNREFLLAYQVVEETNQSVFLTGKAGTGKTTFLKYFKERTRKKYAVLAPTGIAAINAGGVTIHSFFHIKPSVFVPGDRRLRRKAPPDDADRTTIYDQFKYNQDKKDLLANLDIIIIDEISMVRCDLLDVIDRLLRVFGGGNAELPFGGKQMLFIGDGFQLPPVVTGDDQDILGRFYKSPFFFSAQSFQATNPSFIELKKIYRQQGDQQFVDILNRIRIGETKTQDFSILNRRLDSEFDFNAHDYIYLAPYKRMVAETNESRLKQLNSSLWEFQGTIRGKFPKKDLPTKEVLQLKEGAQIMFVKNDTGKRYYNGLIGKVKSIDETALIVETKERREIVLERTSWQRIKYEWDKEEKKVKEIIEGEFIQYPLKLAWAITVHKSQGLTFDEVYADIYDAFAEGQAYVALSRCTSLAGLKLKRKIPAKAIKVSQEVLDFYGLITSKELKPPPLPKIKKFEISTSVARNGAYVEARWEVADGHQFVLDPIGPVQGDQHRFRPRKEMTLQLKVSDEFGAVVKSERIRLRVDLTPPRIVSLTTSHDYVFPGSPFTLEWEVEQAEQLRLRPEGHVSVPQGKKEFSVTEDTTFELVATSFYGVEARQQVSVQVLPLPVVERVVVPLLQVEWPTKVELDLPAIASVNTPNISALDIKAPAPVDPIVLDRDLLQTRQFYGNHPDLRVKPSLFTRMTKSFLQAIDELKEMLFQQNPNKHESH